MIIFWGLPVIVATGRPDALSPAIRKAQGYRLLRKPYAPRELIDVIEAAQRGAAP